MQRPQGHEADDGGAVGIGDDALVGGDVGGVDLGDDQRHVLVETEGVAVVDAHRAALDGLGEQLARDLVARGAEHDVDALEGIGLGEHHRHVLPAEAHGAAHRARARQGHELGHGEVTLLETLNHLLADDARRTKNGNPLAAHRYLPFFISTSSWLTNLS